MHLIGTLHTHTLVLSHIETYKYIKRHAILSITIKLCQTINMLYISIYRCVCVCVCVPRTSRSSSVFVQRLQPLQVPGPPNWANTSQSARFAWCAPSSHTLRRKLTWTGKMDLHKTIYDEDYSHLPLSRVHCGPLQVRKNGLATAR